MEQAQAELERRQEEAAARLEDLAARERAVKRQEDGLEGLKARGCSCVLGASSAHTCQGRATRCTAGIPG